MAATQKTPVTAKDLQGLKYFQVLQPLLERLHPVGTERDQAGNRQLFFDPYAALVLLYFFNPILTSLRAVQQASELDKVQGVLGCSRTSLGSLREAARVFEAAALQEIITELAGRIPHPATPAEQQALKDLTAVDGSLLPALPRRAWALWLDEQHRAAKMHLTFEVLRGIPVHVTVTEGNGSEYDQLRASLQPGCQGALKTSHRGALENQPFWGDPDSLATLLSKASAEGGAACRIGSKWRSSTRFSPYTDAAGPNDVLPASWALTARPSHVTSHKLHPLQNQPMRSSAPTPGRPLQNQPMRPSARSQLRTHRF